MTSVVDFTFSFAALFLALVGAAFWWYLRPTSVRARRALLATIVAYGLASIYVVPYAVGRLLVMGFHEITAADLRTGPTAIVLLGGGSVIVKDWRGGALWVLNAAAAARTLEAFRVYRLTTDAWIISSGGKPDPRRDEPSDAVVMRDALLQLGVPASRIVLEMESGNTHDEAVIVGPMIRALAARQVVVVTSDVHMRRSLGAFRAQGIDAVPAIARDPYRSLPMHEKLLPTRYGLETTGSIAHEFFGLIYYAARGWLRF